MKFDDITDPIERRLADGLTRLAAVARQLDWQTAADAGLSPTQADILRFVAGRPEGARLTAVAAHIGVRKATASDAVSTLETKSLIRKHGCQRSACHRPEDHRQGCKGSRRVWPSSFRPVVDGLSAQEQEALMALVIKMIRQLQLRELIAPQRTCVSCRHFRENIAPGTASPHYCAWSARRWPNSTCASTAGARIRRLIAAYTARFQ